MRSRTKATDMVVIRYRNSCLKHRSLRWLGVHRVQPPGIRPPQGDMDDCAASILIHAPYRRILLTLTVVAFQRKRSESLNELLLRIDLRRGSLRCQGRPDLAVDAAAARQACVVGTLSKNPCMWLWSIPFLKASPTHGDGGWNFSFPNLQFGAIWSVHILSQIFIWIRMCWSQQCPRAAKEWSDEQLIGPGFSTCDNIVLQCSTFWTSTLLISWIS